MEFTGRVWFDFASKDVWTFYQFVRAVASAGGQVGLEWTPLPGKEANLALATFVGIAEPMDKGLFLHAMLGMVHLEGADPGSNVTVAAALEAAGSPAVTIHEDALDEISEVAAGLGVTSVPTLFRHGPVSKVVLNPAALEGDVLARAAVILAVADDDGVWGVVKP